MRGYNSRRRRIMSGSTIEVGAESDGHIGNLEVSEPLPSSLELGIVRAIPR